ncbi:putative efflux pump membrane fusion protein [Gemmata sp. SH-PL17]|uniref:HlyD family secretion protein n=1 Tax=Gemmata sp. SH-PL17 TaxID=1630693 RepID=UPI00078DF399|nr:HlyD family efflux transporter periplasmic adaptor subunit [Gemmata sp. SH-PL17]AMV30413.1 putative efflux pump membrane fusion protein [Gemmata sp. SH-PL17]
MKKIPIPLLVLVAATGAAAAWWYWPRSNGPEQLRLPGTVEIQEVRLASKIGGRVATVQVAEGQVLEPGQVIATFEKPELSARLEQARAKLEIARASLDKANHGSRPEEIAEAKAAAAAARARLARIKAGTREEEKERARTEVEAAVADERQAEEEYIRLKQLNDSGVGARTDFLAAITTRDRTKAHAVAARAALALALAGNRPEEITEAEAEAARADARYELLRKGTREEDKAAAYSAVTEAEAQLAEAETNLREATVTAPERCVVEVLAVRPGDVLPAGQPIARVLRADDLWVKVFVPSTDLGKLKPNQPVEVTVDSHPGQRFRGEITQIASTAEFTPRNVQSADERKHQVFAAKVRVTDPHGVFKSGMAAEVFVTPTGGQ